jgi:hypothetical protein
MILNCHGPVKKSGISRMSVDLVVRDLDRLS